MMPASTSFPSNADRSRYSNGAKRETLLATVAFLVSRLHQWVADQIIQDIPRQLALCEFDCRKTQCTSQEWDTCSCRLHAKAAQPCRPPIR